MPDLELVLPILRCPATGSVLALADGALASGQGGRRYPVVDGVPILLAPERSLFDVEYVLAGATERPGAGGGLRSPARWLKRILAAGPSRTRNVAARDNYAYLVESLRARRGGEARRPRILVVGGAVAGAGADAILDQPDLEVVETDVVLGPRTQLVCDAHDLPFADGAFDAVVIQAVLESLPDPQRVAAEIHRVLCEEGLVYSEAPFVQQVHEGAFDFNRFTHLGHRRLWRGFDELRSGAQCGPGMALQWSFEYFVRALAGRNPVLRAIAGRAASLATSGLKYLDRFLVARPAGIDAASGTFFLGRRRTTPIPDREIVHGFRGIRPRGQRLPSR
jgi:SAM-dependent methyltransferase